MGKCADEQRGVFLFLSFPSVNERSGELLMHHVVGDIASQEEVAGLECWTVAVIGRRFQAQRSVWSFEAGGEQL